VLFFATQSLTNTNIFSSTLDSHLHNQDWRAVAQVLVSHRLETMQTTLDLYAPIFNQAVVLNAKSLIILMALPFAFLLPIMFYRGRQPFAAHVVFSLHLYAFLLLLFCVSLAITAVDVLFGGAGLNSARMDNTLILGVLFAAWHLPLALANRTLAAPYLIAGIASAVVTNWVYYNTHESALLAILYHTAANTLGGFYFFPMFSGPDSVRLWWLYAAVYGVAAVAVVLAAGPNLQRKPHAKTV
jgi:hypothetical protein